MIEGGRLTRVHGGGGNNKTPTTELWAVAASLTCWMRALHQQHTHSSELTGGTVLRINCHHRVPVCWRTDGSEERWRVWQT